MRCEDVSELLVSYLDGELGREEKEAVELHLSACRHCREELEALSATQNQLRQSFQKIAAKGVSPGAWTKLQQCLAARGAVSGGAKSKMEELISWRPIWKPALVGVLATALIIVLAVTLPPYFGQSPEALAAEIAQSDPQVHELLPEGTVVRVAKIVRPMQKDIFHVMFLIAGEGIWEDGDGGKAVAIDAFVNIREKKVVWSRVLKIEAAHIVPLSNVEKEKAIEIAKADSEVQEILSSGAEIRRVIPLPFFQPSGETLTVNVVGVVLATCPSDSQTEAERWIVEVDLIEKEVVNVGKYR